jgi:hypothetical protein
VVDGEGGGRRAVCIVGDVGEGLVVELVEGVGVTGEGVVPAISVPGPAEFLLAEAVTLAGCGVLTG